MNKERSFSIIDEDNGFGRTLRLCEPWSHKFIPIIQRESIRSLRLSLSAGWKNESIDFLDEVPSVVTGFEIYSWKVSDLSPLMDRREIEHLSFEVDLKKVIDLGVFDQLKTLMLSCSAKTKNLKQCHRLEHLNVSAYPAEDLELLASMQSLDRLQISSRKLCCLDGIANLKKMCILDFARCPNLMSLVGLEQVETLEEIEVTDCKAIGTFPDLSSLRKLRSLIIENCGTLESLRFLNAHEALERVLIIGATQVADGDLTPLKTLPNLRDVRVAEGDYNLKADEVLALRQKGD